MQDHCTSLQFGPLPSAFDLFHKAVLSPEVLHGLALQGICTTVIRPLTLDILIAYVVVSIITLLLN